MKLRRFLLIFTIALITVLVLVLWFFPSNDDFRVDNPFWNGVEDISMAIPALPLESLSDLPPSPDGSTLILIPYLDFTSSELEDLSSYVTKGGNLVLADDYGYGNKVLEHLDLNVRFSGQALFDPLFSYRNKWFPMISHLESSGVTGNIENLVLNHATSLANVDDSDTLALSSAFSYLDLNDNQAWDNGEPTGPLPVISHHNLSGGEITIIADPSIIINSMAEMEGNRKLIQNMVANTSRLFIDQSHLPPSTLHQSKNLLALLHDYLTTPGGTLALVILVLAITLMPIWYKKMGGGKYSNNLLSGT